MSDPKHTPGPWEVGGISMNDGSISIRHAQYRIVIADVTNAASLGDFVSASMRGRRDFGAPDTAKTQWANARLISAAPDMYEALKRLVAICEDQPRIAKATVEESSPLGEARAAIAKAEGISTPSPSTEGE